MPSSRTFATKPGWTALVAVFLLALAPALADGEGSVMLRFLSPRDMGRAVGQVVIELQVNPPTGLRPARLALKIDGKPFTTMTTPPWKALWDAGDGMIPHRIEATLSFSDGTEARASVRTSSLKVNQFEQVSLVNVYAVVRDDRNKYVMDLDRGDFRLTENGRSQVIDRFSTERKPLRIAIVLDTSLSMRGDKIDSAREAALVLLDLLQPGDEGVVVTFNDAVQIVEDLTSDRHELSAAIRSTQAMGGTALYDAIYRTADLLEKFDGRRVLVLLSDGRDEAASGLEPGSLHTLDESLNHAVHHDVMVFAIGLGRRLDLDLDFYGKESLETILTRLAETTGGRVLFTPGAGRLKKAFEEVAEDLRHQYSLAYTSDDLRHDGGWREIRLTAIDPALRITARRGYFAPLDSGRTAPATGRRR